MLPSLTGRGSRTPSRPSLPPLPPPSTPGRCASQGQSAAGVTGRMLGGCGRALLSVLLSLLLPAALGIGRVLLTGED